MIITRTPFRVSFFGGGTDFPAFYEKHCGITLSTTIRKFCYISVHKLSPFFKHRYRASYAKTESVLTPDEFQHPLVRECLLHLKSDIGVEIAHVSDLPGRTGLGSSSAFTVGLLHAMHAMCGERVTAEDLAQEAIHVERERVKDAGGHQDQYAAAYGGFMKIAYEKDGTKTINRLTLPSERLKAIEDNLLMFFTGTERSAENLLQEQNRNTGKNEQTLLRMCDMALEAEKIVLSGTNMDSFGELMHESWMLKRTLSSGISNSTIDDLYETARNNGAIGGKLLGAGGRGFLLLWAPPEKHDAVRSKFSTLQEVDFSFCMDGSQVIYQEAGLTDTTVKPKIAFWFRYGAAEHTELFHALPDLLTALSKQAEVHYFGMKSKLPIPEAIIGHCTVHELPLRVNRTSGFDKLIKTALWILWLPSVARKCRKMGIDAVYIDETIPLTAGIAQKHFGGKTAITVADFFVDIYLAPYRLLRPLAKKIRTHDLNTWKKLPLIITRAKTTRDYLAGFGILPDRVHPIYDPCDETIFYPADRTACRKEFGYSDNDVVLVHHGILHPNKGNDRIIRAVARLKDQCPTLKYLLVGDGSELEKLKTLVKELNVSDRVVLTGWLPGRGDVNRALNAGDIGLVMRVGHESDNFHMTGALVHAMACGLPILAARLGGISEVVREEKNGLLFDPVCGDEFDGKLTKMVGNPKLRKELGEEALNDAGKLFSMKSVIDETVETLMNFVKGNP